jgi:hypothetical protein
MSNHNEHRHIRATIIIFVALSRHHQRLKGAVRAFRTENIGLGILMKRYAACAFRTQNMGLGILMKSYILIRWARSIRGVEKN